MIFTIMHSDTIREGGGGLYIPDPIHSKAGLDQVKMIMEFLNAFKLHLYRKIGLLMYPASGKRFKQISQQIYLDFPYIRVMRADFLGDAVAQVNRNNEHLMILPDGDVLEASCFFGLHDRRGFDAWEIIREIDTLVHDDKLLCVGSRFMKALGKKSKSGSVYEINAERQTIKCVMEKGKIKWPDDT